MTDRELLKMAAKAAGYKPDGSFGTGLLVVINAGLTTQKAFPFDPLTDDGDALRLAGRLRFGIKDFSPHDDEPDATPDNTPPVGMIEIWRESDDDPLYVEWYKAGFDRYAATRRAITNAAALIGKDMP